MKATGCKYRERAAKKLPVDEILAALEDIERRLENIERRLERLIESAPPAPKLRIVK